MTNEELLALIESEEAGCISSSDGELAEQRREAMQYYHGKPYGNEMEGRSQIVTTEEKDAIEGILPALMAIFTSSDEIVRFEPQGPEDEERSQQVTDYINYVFSRTNNGFMALYCAFKDALMQKNGHVKVYWEDYADQQKESYENLTDLEMAMLSQDPELTLVSYEAIPMADYVGPEELRPLLYSAVFRRTKSYGRICVDPVPAEEVLVSRQTPNDLNKGRFVEHRTKKTISQIRQMGFNIPDDIAGDAVGADFSLERAERFGFDDSLLPDNRSNSDPSTREVWFCEAYLFVDFDGDGIAEYRKVSKVGKTILDNVEFDSLPIIGGTAIPMPHKYFGFSVHDLIGDIQLIKSTIVRQLFDNAYVANNGRMEVLDGMVNMDDLLTSRPNGAVRVKAIGSIRRIENPLLGAPFYDLLGYFDKMKQNRIGATDFPNAVDPDAINAKAAFVDAFKSAAMERINLMARILAETLVKGIFKKIFELVCKHQNRRQVVRLRNKWVEIDPREWRNGFDMTVTVGTGSGSQQTVLQGAMGIMEIQAMMMKSGLGGRTVSEKNVYNAAVRYSKAVFPKDANSFFSDPDTMPPPQPQPNVDLMKVQVAAKKAEVSAAQKGQKMQMDFESGERDRVVERQKMGVDLVALGVENEQMNRDRLHKTVEGEKDRTITRGQNG